jgi:hypothetical protein
MRRDLHSKTDLTDNEIGDLFADIMNEIANSPGKPFRLVRRSRQRTTPCACCRSARRANTSAWPARNKQARG